jgi:porin
VKGEKMRLTRALSGIICAAVILTIIAAGASAEDDAPRRNPLADCLEQETLTNGFFGVGPTLEEMGLAVSLSTTQVFQANVKGGLSTSKGGHGRWAGSYDLEFELDMEKVLGLPGGFMYARAEGNYNDGISPFVGDLFGVNADAAGDKAVFVPELWYQQDIDAFQVRIGKLDLTGTFQCRGCPVSFDGNSFANDATMQFLNAALANNPTIPFPDPGIGVVVHWNPIEPAYFSVGIGDAEAVVTRTGLSTAFSGDADYFYIAEGGYVPQFASDCGPLTGAYRFGIWLDDQEKVNVWNEDNIKHGDMGWYISCDQKILNEQGDECQGLGAWMRFGQASQNHHDPNLFRDFWGLGVQYQGAIPTRDGDVVAIGIGQGSLANRPDFDAPHETVIEMYYNAQVTPFCSVTPDLQIISNPGDNEAKANAVVVGTRFQISI